MTVQVPDELKSEISRQKDTLANDLGLDPNAFQPFVIEGEEDIFPVIPESKMLDIAAGRANDLLARTIDHTLLKPEAVPEQVTELCEEAIAHSFGAVCVNGVYVPLAARALDGTGIALAAVVGFPLGQMATAMKAEEARLAVEEGAGEIDMVVNIGWVKAGLMRDVYEDVRAVVRAAGVPVKVILETCLLSDAEKIGAGLVSRFAGAAFLKTSTGFSTGGATPADVALLRAIVGDGAGVKASGGVRSRDDAVAMLRAGANRIGTSSGVVIVG